MDHKNVKIWSGKERIFTFFNFVGKAREAVLLWRNWDLCVGEKGEEVKRINTILTYITNRAKFPYKYQYICRKKSI